VPRELGQKENAWHATVFTVVVVFVELMCLYLLKRTNGPTIQLAEGRGEVWGSGKV